MHASSDTVYPDEYFHSQVILFGARMLFTIFAGNLVSNTIMLQDEMQNNFRN